MRRRIARGMSDGDRVVTAGFHARVYDVVRRVPAGSVTTYGDVAAVLGTPRVARHVGWALAACKEPDVPWQRVINAQGRISFKGDTGRGVLQRSLLEAEGIEFSDTGKVDLRQYRYRYDLDEE